jgi:putative transposase
MDIPTEILDAILKNYQKPEDLMGEGGIIQQLTKQLIERCLTAEIDTYLTTARQEENSQIEGTEPSISKSDNRGKNRRNGYSKKKIKGEFGEAEIAVPRDRRGEFEPLIVRKGETRFTGFDDKILALYARGMTTRDIQAQLEELYGVNVSHTLISNVTEAVEEERKAWQNRTLESIYPIVFFDAIVVKVRQEGRVINKAVHLALGINMQGKKELLGLWITENESAKFWLGVMTELKNRGLKDILIACADGLTGMPEAINTVFPETKVQLCIVHMLRNSFRYVSYKDLKAVATDLKLVYTAATEQLAEQALMDFAQRWDKKYPNISKSWFHHWPNIITFFVFPDEIRKVIYTTNTIESVNMTLRKVLKNHRIFPNEQSVMRAIYLAINNLSKKWTMPIRDWKRALNHLAIEFEGRLPL